MITHEVMQDFLERHANVKHFYLGLSGGMDSISLCHNLVSVLASFPDISLHALFVNHALSDQAEQWQQFCAGVCERYSIEFTALPCSVVSAAGISVEAKARELRYQAFKPFITSESCLLTAHHEDDQAETLLLQLIRGAGVRGLSSMPVISRFSAGSHWRPLLSASQASIAEYARQHDLSWVTDESNADRKFDRNYLRHEIIPKLSDRWPAAARTISRSAYHCQQAEGILREVAEQDLEAVRCIDDNTLYASKLIELSSARCRNVLRYWIQSRNIPLPNSRKIEHIVQDVLTSRYDKTPCVDWPGGEVKRFRDKCYLEAPRERSIRSQSLAWPDLTKPLALPKGGGTLVARRVRDGVKFAKSQQITVRFRCGGESIRSAGRGLRKSLKSLFQEWGIPPWRREEIPLIYCGDELVAIVGYGVSESHRALNGEPAWEISFDKL